MSKILHEAKQTISKISKESGGRRENSYLRIKIACIYTLHNSFVMILYHFHGNHFASALHKDILYRNDLKAIC